MVNYQGLKKEKKESKTSKKKSKKTFLKSLSKKLPSKRILKKQQPTLTIKHKEVESVLGDPNRFFKDEMQKEFELWHSHVKWFI